MGHIYTKKIFIIYLKFKFYWDLMFLFAKFGNSKSMELNI